MPTIWSPRSSATPNRSASGTSFRRIFAPHSWASKASTAAPYTLLEDVVAEDHADLVAIGKMLGQAQSVGNAAFALLIRVVQVRETELLTVGKQAEEIAGVSAAGYEQDVLDTRIDERLNRVVDHRLVVDRQQMLVGDLRERETDGCPFPRPGRFPS